MSVHIIKWSKLSFDTGSDAVDRPFWGQPGPGSGGGCSWLDHMSFYFITHAADRYILYGHLDVLYVYSDRYILYGHFDVLYVYFQIHVYIMDTLMFYMLFPDTCLYHGHFDVLYVISRYM